VDVVLGDNGSIVNDGSGALRQVVTGDPLLGGSDTISTGGGNDIAAGGAQGDVVNGGAGNDVLFGDGGRVTVSAGGTRLDIVSVDVQFGGDDTLDGGTGNDVLIGGQGNDLLYGSLSEDLLFGSNAAVTLVNGLVTSIFSDLQDLVTEALFKLYNALPGEDQPLLQDVLQRLDEVSALLDPMDPSDPLLDVNLFRKLFALGAQARTLLAGGEFQALFASDVVSEPEAPAHAPLLESGDAEAELLPAQAAAEGVVLAGLQVAALEELLAALAADDLPADLALALRGEWGAFLLGLACMVGVRPLPAGAARVSRIPSARGGSIR
jgi:hypothetical protein